MKKYGFAILFAWLSFHCNAQQTPAEIDAMMKKIQKQTDSILNDPKIKAYLDKAKAVNVDSLKQAAEKMKHGGSGQVLPPDTSSYTIPQKNLKVLGAIPKKTLSGEELKIFLAKLDKKIIPALHAAYGTPVVNTDKYDANTISDASMFACEAGKVDQAVILAIKAAEKDPDNPVVLNNTGAILKKGGIEIAAIPILESALEKDPGNSTVQNNLGQSYLTLGDRAKAEQYLQQCVSKSRYHPHANTALAVISLENGNKQAALNYTENSLRGAFTDKAWHLLYKLKKDASIMDYFKHRYKQPEYFNEDKYHLPMQCESVKDIPAMKAEYKAYRDMVERAEKKFKEIGDEEMEKGPQSMLQKVKDYKKSNILKSPFLELANAMLLDATLRMDNSGADEIARSQKKYHQQIKILEDEYKEKRKNTEGCAADIALANEYMEKMSVVTREYQKTYLRIWKDYYHDNAYWSFFSSPDEHVRKGIFCGQTRTLLGVLLQLAETHFLEVTIDCASDEELKKEKEEMEIEADCPFGDDGFEFPYAIGKFNFSCEKIEFQFGEVLILNIGHNYSTGETTWAIGPGVSFIGPGEDAIKKVPELHFLGMTPSLDVGIKGQVYWTFREGALMDWGGKFTGEFDILGIAKEFKTSFTIGANTGLQMEEGALKTVIDKVLGPSEEVVPQINKNVKKYKTE